MNMNSNHIWQAFAVLFIVTLTAFVFNILMTSKYVGNSTEESPKLILSEPSDDDVVQPLRLRLDYTSLERLSPVAKHIEHMQNNCSLPSEALYKHRNWAGLGSDIHVYGIGLCNVLEMSNTRLRTIGSWPFRDDETCNRATNANVTIVDESPMTCYFPQAEPVCPDEQERNQVNLSIADKQGNILQDSCPQYTQRMGGTPMIRAGTTEYLFTRVSNVVIEEAERQLSILFGNYNNLDGKKSYSVPKNLVTVHIRWGDKHSEMNLVSIQNYIDAIQQLLDQRKEEEQQHLLLHDSSKRLLHDDKDGVNILLSTEDPEVVAQFMASKPKPWNVHLDQYYVEMLQYRNEIGNIHNVNVQYSSILHGRNGLVALGSLLVAMESNDFVLTTGSNWSRLMNEIRKNIIHPRCNNCTKMIDLAEGEYR